MLFALSLFICFLLAVDPNATAAPTPAPTPSPTAEPTTAAPSAAPVIDTPAPTLAPTPSPTPAPVAPTNATGAPTTPAPTATKAPTETAAPTLPPVDVPAAFFGQLGSNAVAKPGARASAITTFDGDNVTIYGGLQANGAHVADTWAYSLKANTWSQLNISFRVSGGCYIPINSTGFYVFGGYVDGVASQTLWIFNTTIAYHFNATENPWTNFSVSPFATGLLGMSCVAIENGNKLLLFGGATDDPQVNRIYIFSVKHGNWSQHDTHGLPSKQNRIGASLYAINTDPPEKTELLLWGGDNEDNDLWTLNLTSHEWTKKAATVQAGAPSPRRSHVSSFNAASPVANLIIYGGVNGENYLGDAWYYNLKNNSWKQLSYLGIPANRSQASFVFQSERFFFFGGEQDHGTLADLWQFSVELNCLVNAHCTDCTQIPGCGWCDSNPTAVRCIAGSVTPYLNGTCNNLDKYNIDLHWCPLEGLQGWIIAIIIVVVVIFIGLLWFYLVNAHLKPKNAEYTMVQ